MLALDSIANSIDAVRTQSAEAGTSAGTVVTVALRAGIWRVTVNGHFYGDYHKKRWALEAAMDKAREIDPRNRPARVVVFAPDGAIASETLVD